MGKFRKDVGRAARGRHGRERGSVAIMTVGALILIIGFCGLALDLSRAYNRKMELQSVADVAALAAARELNGTRGGVTNALAAAAARFAGTDATAVTYQYGKTMSWTDGAIRFGATPDGPWQNAGSALDAPGALLYAQVDTRGLDPAYGLVTTMFMPFFSRALSNVTFSARATAGRAAIRAVPFGLCAMRPEERRDRGGELEEFGFRRGVSYDLMQLNPDAQDAGISFLIDPLVVPGASATPAIDLAAVEPYVCTGTLAMQRLKGAEVSVVHPFPLSTFVQHLNSRFFNEPSVCDPNVAPPDANVKAYTFDTQVPWMDTLRDGQSSALREAGGKRWTVAGPDPTPTDATAGQFGPLWAYAKAVQYAASEPSGGYVAYGTGSWSALYNPGQPKAKSTYPSPTPYAQSSGTTYYEPPKGSHKGVRQRRVLNVPLLECPVSGSRARVVGIGKFFMTVPADDTHLHAEFAGLAAEASLNIQMRLHP